MNKFRLDCFRYASLGEVFELGSDTMYPMLTISAVGLFIVRPFGDSTREWLQLTSVSS